MQIPRKGNFTQNFVTIKITLWLKLCENEPKSLCFAFFFQLNEIMNHAEFISNFEICMVIQLVLDILIIITRYVCAPHFDWVAFTLHYVIFALHQMQSPNFKDILWQLLLVLRNEISRKFMLVVL